MPGHSGAYVAADIRSFSAGFDPSQRFLITATADWGATVYEIKTGQPLFHLRGHAGEVAVAQFAACPLAGGLCAVTASLDNSVMWWALGTDQLGRERPALLDTIPRWLGGIAEEKAAMAAMAVDASGSAVTDRR